MLGIVVVLLDVNVRRSRADEVAPARRELRVDLALEYLEILRVLADLFKIVLDVRLYDGYVVLDLVGKLDDLVKILLKRLMVATVHTEQVVGGGKAGGGLYDAFKTLFQSIGIARKLHCVVIPVAEHNADDFRAVGSAPDQLALRYAVFLDDVAFSTYLVCADVVNASAEYGVVDTEAADDLRRLRYVTEGIGEVAALDGLCADLLAKTDAVEHITDVRFAAR